MLYSHAFVMRLLVISPLTEVNGCAPVVASLVWRRACRKLRKRAEERGACACEVHGEVLSTFVCACSEHKPAMRDLALRVRQCHLAHNVQMILFLLSLLCLSRGAIRQATPQVPRDNICTGNARLHPFGCCFDGSSGQGWPRCSTLPPCLYSVCNSNDTTV